MDGTLQCPAGVETLLWYHARAEKIHDSRVHRHYTAMLERNGCIESDSTSGSGYRTTEKGKLMVDWICSIPFPTPSASASTASCTPHTDNNAQS